jgi:hypothetical protein
MVHSSNEAGIRRLTSRGRVAAGCVRKSRW